MARRSQRLSSGSKATPTSTHKRAASNTAIQGVEAKRSKTKKATPIKSRYFKKPVNPERSDDDEQEDIEESTEADEEASEFGKESEELSSSEGEDADYDNDSDEAPKSRKIAKPSKGATSPTTIRTKGGELWRPGVKAGLGPGNQVVIKKPQARPEGNTPYQDETIHHNTLLFLKDLKENNERQWLKSKCRFLLAHVCATSFRYRSRNANESASDTSSTSRTQPLGCLARTPCNT